MSKLKNATLELFEKIIGYPVTFDYTMPVRLYDLTNVLGDARRQKILVIRAGQKISYKRAFWVYLPEVSPDWLEIGIKDIADNGSFKAEKLRYSEACRIDQFLRDYGKVIYGQLGDHEFYASLGTADDLRNYIQIVMEENYKKGRHI